MYSLGYLCVLFIEKNILRSVETVCMYAVDAYKKNGVYIVILLYLFCLLCFWGLRVIIVKK